MSDNRRAIENPLWMDFTATLMPPLRFVVQEEHEPTGLLQRPAPGLTLAHTPWYTEMTIELDGADAVAVLYLVSKDERSNLLVACIDETFEPLFGVMSGNDFGDSVTALVARHWPDIYRMLVDSGDGGRCPRILANLVTRSVEGSKVQWIVADQLPADQDAVSTEHTLDLITSAVHTSLRASSFLTELPDVILALGGPDRVSRRLKAAGGLFTATGELGTGFVGGVEVNELNDMFKAAKDWLASARALKD